MSKWLYLLRTFFPSWEFFNDVGLEYNIQIQTSLQSSWENLIPPISRNIKGLLMNPSAASIHSYYNLLQYLHAQMGKDEFKIESSSTFLILKNLANQTAKSDFKMRVIARSLEEDHVLFETPYYKKGDLR